MQRDREVCRLAGKNDFATKPIPLEALRMLKAAPYDLAIVDMHMPGMDSAMLAQAVRGAGRRLPLVLFTSLGRKDREECLAAGMDDYLTKPIRVDALVEALINTQARKD